MKKVTLLKGLRGGMNEIEPLMSYVKEKVTVPSLECCLPAKDLVMEFAMRSIWRRICGGSEAELRKAFAQLDEDKNGQLSKEEVQKKLKRSGRSRKSTKSHTLFISISILQVISVIQKFVCIDVPRDSCVSMDVFELFFWRRSD